jgi:hypothetical protein
MTPVPKKTKVPLSLLNARGVVLAPVPGKVLGRMLRCKAVPVLQHIAGHLQSGSLPGGGCHAPSMTVRALATHARTTRRAIGFLFVDIRAAVYSCLVEEVFGSLLTVSSLRAALSLIGFTEAQQVDFGREFVLNAPVMEQRGLEHCWSTMLRSWHSGSWFSVEGGTRTCKLRTGTRPGDPLADLIFAVTFARVQEDLLEALCSAGLVFSLPLSPGGPFARQGSVDETDVEVGMPTFMDDAVVPIEAPDASVLLQKAAEAAVIAVSVCAKHGLVVNFGIGKTEFLAVVAGRGSRACRDALSEYVVQVPGGDPVPAIPLGDGLGLRVVQQYKHLGVTAHAGASMGAEVSARCGQAAVATAALGRSCFGKSGIPQAVRAHVAAACVHSRLTYMTGTWGPLSDQQFLQFAAAYCKPLGIIAGVHRPPVAGADRAWNDAVLASVGVATRWFRLSWRG